MKDMWYGDKRDVVKWGGIVHLCRTKGIRTIVQVAYYRWKPWPKLVFDDKPVDLSKEVIKHFKDIDDIRGLGPRTGLTIRVFKGDFSQSTRTEYHLNLCRVIKMMNERKVVLLDPDVGLAPSRVEAEHVSGDEVAMVWESLNEGDVLILYQHAFRSPKWADIRRTQLARVCSVDMNAVAAWHAERIAKDVVLFHVERRNEPRKIA